MKTHEIITHGCLSAKINEWIKKHPEAKITNIKYAVVQSDESIFSCALILYEEDPSQIHLLDKWGKP